MDKTFDPMTIFWLFFILVSLQPVIKRKVLDSTRQQMIAKIEKLRNSRVILIVHRQESMSLLGFPLMKFINMEDSEEVLRAIETSGNRENIDIVLHTPGGMAIAALQIARAIMKCSKKVRVIVPHYAMSGGTLIALAADEIIMSPYAVLGPVDPQLGEYPAPSLVNLKQIKDINRIEDRTLILADVAEKATNQMQEAIEQLMEGNYGKEKAAEISKKLTQGLWTHDFPITVEKAEELGLHVTTDYPKEFIQLMSLYPQPVKQTKSVEYLPANYENNG